ncbi:hypothetical protein GPECTOR_137g645 [Gonium pectorale]|uniref:Two-component response regulator n=1 Tax=Gonium pectorale TaxID=33097 RepID=A0A150FY70_GONPE|nr:hypothetical protein GPECTOR_137g645 [Gonium pectorale]|eukprot:KXZ42538.1 hypothetical protein GPECTOR_137g645 [Gonium pectorale]
MDKAISSITAISVLVVDDDPLCLKVVEQMLRRCSYEVTTCTNASSALHLLREKVSEYDLVLSDVYMPDMDGFKLLEVVGLEMDLPVIMMSSNGDTSNVLRGVTHGACDYLIKPVRLEELRNLWQHVVRRRRQHAQDLDSDEQSQERDDDPGRNKRKMEVAGLTPDQFRANGSTLLNGAASGALALGGSGSVGPGGLPGADELGLGADGGSNKKARVVWSVEMHQQFVNAVNTLGIDKAVPKKILEIMNVEGLTRENVASHLQKYRLYLKRVSGVQPSGQQRSSSKPAQAQQPQQAQQQTPPTPPLTHAPSGPGGAPSIGAGAQGNTGTAPQQNTGPSSGGLGPAPLATGGGSGPGMAAGMGPLSGLAMNGMMPPLPGVMPGPGSLFPQVPPPHQMQADQHQMHQQHQAGMVGMQPHSSSLQQQQKAAMGAGQLNPPGGPLQHQSPLPQNGTPHGGQNLPAAGAHSGNATPQPPLMGPEGMNGVGAGSLHTNQHSNGASGGMADLPAELLGGLMMEDGFGGPGAGPTATSAPQLDPAMLLDGDDNADIAAVFSDMYNSGGGGPAGSAGAGPGLLGTAATDGALLSGTDGGRGVTDEDFFSFLLKN